MKKVFIAVIAAILTLTLCIGGIASAQEAETALPDPGTTPDSPFYFMDKWGKQISLAFTFNAEKKAQKALRYADERMAEMDAMMVKNKIKEATQAANEYRNCLEITVKNMEQARLKGADVSEKVALMAEKHLAYLSDCADNATEGARMIMTQARERAMVSQETALQNMAQNCVQNNEQIVNRLQTQNQIGQVPVEAPVPQGAMSGQTEHNPGGGDPWKQGR